MNGGLITKNMLYLIGLGLDKKDISLKALEAIKACDKVYLETYTNVYYYSQNDVEKTIKRKVIPADRKIIEEGKEILEQAKKQKIALLVSGDPLAATTHVDLLLRAKKMKIKAKIIHAPSIFTAISETGLQLYKFGKITSIPGFEAESFIEIIKDNLKINAHSLILVDIDLESKDALDKLDKVINKNKIQFDKIIICSRLGTKDSKIFYDNIEKLMKIKIEKPYCIIIPGKLHFFEKEVLEIISS